MESKNTQSLEENLSSAKILAHAALDLGKFFIPYIGDKAIHKLCNKTREIVDEKEFLDFPKLSITAVEVLFYTGKYVLLGNLAYQIGRKIF